MIMVKNRKLWVVVALALALGVATSPASFGAASFGLKVVGYATSANVVYVTVSNQAKTTQSGTVVVSAVVSGAQVTSSAPFTAAGSAREPADGRFLARCRRRSRDCDAPRHPLHLRPDTGPAGKETP